MYKIKVAIEGVAPMVQMNPWSLVDDINRITPSKGASQYYDERSLYRDEQGFCCVPSRHIKGAMKSVSKYIKLGKKNIWPLIKAYIWIKPDLIRINVVGKNNVTEPDDIEKNIFPDKMGKQHYIERPMFNIGWQLQFEITCLQDDLNEHKVKECLAMAGEMSGIGAHRPDFGRFIITEFEKM